MLIFLLRLKTRTSFFDQKLERRKRKRWRRRKWKWRKRRRRRRVW